jgi:hypothetical protein
MLRSTISTPVAVFAKNAVLPLTTAAAFSSAAAAVDLSVSAVEITQSLQTSTGTIALIAKNATMVRVKVSLNGQASVQPGVDAVLRIYSNGIEIVGSPVYSTNGPISAPVAPNSANVNDTLNFLCLPPQSADVDFVVTVNPFRAVAESNHDNNTFTVSNKIFACRKMVDIAYTPINYTFGAGLPSNALIEPGVGDAFLRGIFKTGDWNYHRSPLAPPIVSTSIDTANAALLNTLSSLRQTTIPAAGFARPEFIYGWLPGNPFSGNGQASGIPGDAAFGNTENIRFQRTFAHEIGHCWGLSHNTTSIGVVAIDVEHQLRDPLLIAQIMPATKKDIMYAGLNTADAWVASGSYLDCLNDARSACTAIDGADGDASDGAGANDVPEGAIPVLRLSGSHDHLLRTVALDHAMPNELVLPTADNPAGNVLIESFDSRGARLASIRLDTRGCRESCADPSHQHRFTSLFVNLPRWIDGREAAQIEVREISRGVPGKRLANLRRSAHAPEIATFAVTAVGPDAAGVGSAQFNPSVDRLEGVARISWSATDADGDALVADLLYSPNGGDAWLPVTVAETSGMFEFDTCDLPASRGANGRFRIRVSDGMNSVDVVSSQAMLFGNSQPPDVHIIAPNSATTYPAGATVLLHGAAWDIDDQLLPENSITWTSSRDGLLGGGRLFVRRNLSVGVHTITLRGTDSGGLSAERAITLTITARDYNRGDVNGDGIIGAADLATLLSTWGTNGLADLNLDGWIDSADLATILSNWS